MSAAWLVAVAVCLVLACGVYIMIARVRRRGCADVALVAVDAAGRARDRRRSAVNGVGGLQSRVHKVLYNADDDFRMVRTAPLASFEQYRCRAHENRALPSTARRHDFVASLMRDVDTRKYAAYAVPIASPSPT